MQYSSNAIVALNSALSYLAMCRIDEKIRKLEEQLVKHRETIKRARPGPAQDAAKRRALGVSYPSHCGVINTDLGTVWRFELRTRGLFLLIQSLTGPVDHDIYTTNGG